MIGIIYVSLDPEIQELGSRVESLSVIHGSRASIWNLSRCRVGVLYPVDLARTSGCICAKLPERTSIIEDLIANCGGPCGQLSS